MNFDSPFELLVYGYCLGLTVSVVIHYIVWPLSPRKWLKWLGVGK